MLCATPWIRAFLESADNAWMNENVGWVERFEFPRDQLRDAY